MNIDRDSNHLIGVIGPRHQGNYTLILGGIIRALDLVAHEDEQKNGFVFVHDGVTIGSTGEVIEVLNKTQSSLSGYGYEVQYKKQKLDIEMYGKKSHQEWINRIVKQQPDLMLIFDDSKTYYLRHAVRQAADNNILTSIVEVASAD